MARNQFIGNQRTAPQWLADWAGREHLAVFPAKLVAGAFSDAMGIQLVVGAAGAAANATTVPIDALTFPNYFSTVNLAAGSVLVPSGTNLYFGGAKKFAKLTADVILGATSITVEALPTALVDNDTAVYSKYNTIMVPSGTLVGRTYAERDANTGFGPADVATPDDEIFLTAFDVVDLNESNDVELVRHTTRVKENYLPNYTVLSAPQLAAIRARYQSFKGTD